MRNAIRTLTLAFAAAALAACQKQEQPAANQDMSIEGNLAAGELPANAEIETLPPDEGSDNPDVNDLNASSNSH
jgi:hypothetical protein